jgi:hypothetical protein
MQKFNRLPRYLVIAGAVLLFVGAAIHTLAAYPRVSAAIASSNLKVVTQAAMRAVFLLAGLDWLAIGVLALFAMRTGRWRRMLLLFCGITILAETLITLEFLGPFVGNEIIGSAAVLILAGAVLFKAEQGAS